MGNTPKSVMDVFKANPAKVFPFQVHGCGSFANRTSCTLVDATPLQGTGRVWVTTTDTSVKFTVTSNGYFDPPGSSITFSTFSRNGFVYLQQEASVSQANLRVAAGVDAGLAFNTWSQQAANLSGLLQ